MGAAARPPPCLGLPSPAGPPHWPPLREGGWSGWGGRDGGTRGPPPGECPLPQHLGILQEKVSWKEQVHVASRINVLSLIYLNRKDTPCDFTQTLGSHAPLSCALRRIWEVRRERQPLRNSETSSQAPITESRKPTTAPPPGSPRVRVHCHLWCPLKTHSQLGHSPAAGTALAWLMPTKPVPASDMLCH